MYSITILRVEDYPKWKDNFDSEESKDARRAVGEESYQIFRTVDDPNTFVLLNEWEDEEKARGFLKSENLRELQQHSGVLGEPDMYLFGEVEKGSI